MVEDRSDYFLFVWCVNIHDIISVSEDCVRTALVHFFEEYLSEQNSRMCDLGLL